MLLPYWADGSLVLFYKEGFAEHVDMATAENLFINASGLQMPRDYSYYRLTIVFPAMVSLTNFTIAADRVNGWSVGNSDGWDYSTDTTNGINGTWVDGGSWTVGSTTVGAVVPVSHDIDAKGIRAISFRYYSGGGGGSTQNMHGLQLEGEYLVDGVISAESTTYTWDANELDGVATALRAAGGVTVIASAQHSGDWAATEAFDGSLGLGGGSTGWLINGAQTPGWVGIDFGVNATLTPTHAAFRTFPDTDRHPEDFKIQGSNDNSVWDDLLTVTAAGLARGTWWDSTIVGSSAYRFLRLYVSLNHPSADQYVGVSELEFWGTYDIAQSSVAASTGVSLWHPTLDEPLSTIDFNTAQGKVQDIDFRVKNLNASNASDITLDVTAPQNSALESEATFSDGGAFSRPLSIGALNAGVTSSVVTLRITKDGAAALGQQNLFIIPNITWS